MASPQEFIFPQNLQSSLDAFYATKYLAGAEHSRHVTFYCRLMRYSAAGLVCILYDHIVTLDAEVSTIWNGSCPTVTKVMYVISRYVIEGMLMTVAYCESFYCFSKTCAIHT